jgi:ABC-type enterochelin transport system substrate-binding protein
MVLLVVLIMAMTTITKASLSTDQATVKMENRQTATATVTQEMGVVQLETEKQSVGGFLAQNWGILSLSLLSFLEVVTRLTPTEKDNTVLTFLSNILNAIIPNFKKGGGRL